jgi:hypothetical protein
LDGKNREIIHTPSLFLSVGFVTPGRHQAAVKMNGSFGSALLQCLHEVRAAAEEPLGGRERYLMRENKRDVSEPRLPPQLQPVSTSGSEKAIPQDEAISVPRGRLDRKGLELLDIR